MSTDNAIKNVVSAVRKKCLPGHWALATKLTQEASVRIESREKDEIRLRVVQEGRAVVPTVVLYLEDPEWSCDCDSRADPCVHVAASVIALQDFEQRGVEMPMFERAKQTVGYRLRVSKGELAIDRVVKQPDGSEAPLTRALSNTGDDVGIVVTSHDLAIDRLMEHATAGVLPADRRSDLFAELSECADVALADESIRISSEPIAPRAFVDDDGTGFVLRIEKDRRVQAVLARGVVRTAKSLHLAGEIAITGPNLEKLPVVKQFAFGDIGDLVLDILPNLSKSIDVTVRTTRLPARESGMHPRVLLELTHRRHTLSVLPTIVYGDPPQARLEGSRLKYVSGALPVRNQSEESELLRRLRDEMNLVTSRRVDFEGADAMRFANKLKQWNHSGGDDMFEERVLSPTLNAQNDSFDLMFETTDEAGEKSTKRASAEAVIRAWEDGFDLVPLDGGGWAPLPQDWLEKYGHRVADLLAARRDDGELPKVAIPALAKLCDDLEQPRPPGFQKLAPLIENFDAMPEASLPEDLVATLRTYQKEGVNWLCFLREAGLGAVLADDMGLGKTLQTLCAVRGRTLVISPKSVVFNWADEIRRFRPKTSMSIYHGARRKLDDTASITLTTYAMLRSDADALSAFEWDTVVLDEAQAIKNPDSQVARAAFGLRAKFRITLSGTPIENRLEELWSQFHFANRGLLGGRSDFHERYALPIANGENNAAQRLRAQIRPFVLRRLKRDVAPELPPRTDVLLYCELDETERSIYDAVRVATEKDVVSKLENGGNVLAALEALLRLRQAACHPALVPGQRATNSSKLERLLESLEEVVADGHKALVFSQWTSLLDLVEPHLREASIPFTRLDGSTRDRSEVVTEFQSREGPPVMLVSLKAGGTGLNLTAADHVFLLDPWWNPAVEDQAADRAHRIGQDRPVMVYRMVAKDTVEERIVALQNRKRALADVALGESDQAGGLTRGDLLALLQ